MSTRDLSAFADALTGRAAVVVTRRRLLRNAGAATVGVAVGSRILGWGTPGARAAGTPSSPCGPSPLCPGSNCFNGQCSNCAGRIYDTFTCNPGNPGGCWIENYCGNTGKYQCCDCCCFNGGGNKCGTCGDSNSRYACVCRKQLAC